MIGSRQTSKRALIEVFQKIEPAWIINEIFLESGVYKRAWNEKSRYSVSSFKL